MFLAVALLAGACSSGRSTLPSTTAKVTVLSLTARPYTFERSLPGRLTAYLSANVTPQVTGVIQKRFFAEGADVKQGDLLYQLDPGTYQGAYEQAVANLANAKAALLSARPQVERYEKLVAADAVSKQDYDAARATLEQDEASVLADQAAVDSARVNLAYTKIKAPISGRITTSAYTVGALVTADQATALANIYQFDPLYVDVTQSSAQYLQLRQDLAAGRLQSDQHGGTAFELLLENGTTYAQQGSLQAVGVAVDENTGTITLRGTIANPDKLLLPNMYVHAVLKQGTDQDALWVPQQAVTHDMQGDAIAMVVGADNKVEQRTLTVAGTQDSYWVVQSGLKAGERVIVSGGQNVKAGDTVQAEEQAAATPASDTPAAASTSTSH